MVLSREQRDLIVRALRVAGEHLQLLRAEGEELAFLTTEIEVAYAIELHESPDE